MPASTKSNKLRRREVRRTLGRPERLTLRQLLAGRRMMWGVVFGLVFWVLATLIVVQGRREPRYRVGELVDRPIISRVDLEWVDEYRTNVERESARDKAPSVYELNKGFYERIRQEFVSLPGAVANAASVRDVAPALVDSFALDDDVIRQLKQYQKEGQPTDEWVALVDKLIDELQWRPIIDQKQFQLEKTSRAPNVRLILADGETREVGKILLLNLEDRDELVRKLRSVLEQFPAAIRPSVEQYLRRLREPGFLPNFNATSQSKLAAEAQVQPVSRTYKAGEVIVPAGEPLTDDRAALLRVERERYRATFSPMVRWLVWAGPAVMVLLVTLGIAATVLAIRPRVAENPMRGLAMTGLLLGTLALAWGLNPAAPYITVGVAVGAAMLAAVILVIAYDEQFAIAVSALQAVLIAMALNMTAGTYFVALAASVLAIAQVRGVRHRSTLIKMGFVTGLVAALGAFAVGLAEKNIVQGIFTVLAWQALAAFVSSLLVGFLVLGVLPFIERAFKVTTAMTLLELGDVNRPLLRRLAQAAPGTFNHSLTIAILAEAAADAIGADGLLCRVGAYYHDIGKMNKPQYFIENQGGGPNRHDKLSPAMSLLIIVGHVKDGMEMAREYGLPRCVHQFIATHHGTTLVEYFYHAARQQAGETDPQPSEFEFRYPGPKPQSREAAILMLCDTVESASRTLPDPSPNRIEQLVHKLAMKRLMDGQFDESALTLDELHRVEEAITKSLGGILHGRIKYPTDKPREQPMAPPAGAGGGRAAG